MIDSDQLNDLYYICIDIYQWGIVSKQVVLKYTSKYQRIKWQNSPKKNIALAVI